MNASFEIFSVFAGDHDFFPQMTSFFAGLARKQMTSARMTSHNFSVFSHFYTLYYTFSGLEFRHTTIPIPFCITFILK